MIVTVCQVGQENEFLLYLINRCMLTKTLIYDHIATTGVLWYYAKKLLSNQLPEYSSKRRISAIHVTERWARSWSRCTGSQPAGEFLSHPPAEVGCHYFPPGLRSPTQSNNVTSFDQTIFGKIKKLFMILELKFMEPESQSCYWSEIVMKFVYYV